MNAKKFLLLGLTAIISINALAAPVLQTEQGMEKLHENVKTMQQQNIIPKIPINFIIKPDSEINKDRVNAGAFLNINEESCVVNIDVTADMKISYSGTLENREALKSVTGSSNAIQEELRTQYITYHEASHCKLYEIKDVFQHSNKQVESLLNSYFKFSGTSYGSKHGDASLYYMLHENFADSAAFIHMLKANGPTKDVLETMQKIQIERSDAANEYNKNGLIVHNSEFALKEILKPENIKKILATDSAEGLEKMALEFANKGLWESVATYANKDVSRVIHLENMENGTRFLLLNLMAKDYSTVNTANKNIDLNMDGNKLLTIAQEVKDTISKTMDTSSIKDEPSLNKFTKDNFDKIKEIISEKVDAQLTKELSQNVDVMTVLSDGISMDSPHKVKTVAEIKADGISDLAAVAQTASKLSKSSVLNKMEKMRTATFAQNNSTITVKYGS